MGVKRFALGLALLAGCDKGQVEPTQGSAQPVPLPVRDPQPPVDAMSIDEQLLRGIDPTPVAMLNVRLCNDTGHDITKVFYHDKFAEGAVKKGACTAYRPTTWGYSYTFVTFSIGNAKFALQPFDYMGEQPLAAGYWSYHLRVPDFPKRQAEIIARRRLRERVCDDTDEDIRHVDELAWVHTQPPDARIEKHTCTPYVEVDRAMRLFADYRDGTHEIELIADDPGVGESGDWSNHIAIERGSPTSTLSMDTP
jgi:hypothetical protein